MNKKLKLLKTYVSYILEPLKVYDYKNELEDARYENDELHSEYLDIAYKNNELKNNETKYIAEIDELKDTLFISSILSRMWFLSFLLSVVANIGLIFSYFY